MKVKFYPLNILCPHTLSRGKREIKKKEKRNSQPKKETKVSSSDNF